MSKEREIVILDIERKEVIKRLKELTARHIGEYKFKRIEFMLDGDIGSGHSWVRVRTDGKSATITLKETKGEGGFGAMEEYEVKTDNFADTVRIMSKIAKTKIIYFENWKRRHMLKQAYITIDKWPGIPAFVEIEAPSMKILKETYKRLGIKGKFFGTASIDRIYKNYGLNFRKVVERNEPELKRLLGS